MRRKYQVISIRVRAANDPLLPTDERMKAALFDQGWAGENKGKPLTGATNATYIQGWLAARTARLARHYAINGYDQ